MIEKVNDLVDQLREFGPQIQVTVLDTQAEDFADLRDEVTENRPLPRRSDPAGAGTASSSPPATRFSG